MSMEIRITKTVQLTPEELAQVPTVSYYAHGAEWSSITITYIYDPEDQTWGVYTSRGSSWRLTAKGERIRNSLTSGDFPRVPNDIVRANMPTEKITIAVVETGEVL